MTSFVRAVCGLTAVLLLPAIASAAGGGGSKSVLAPDLVNSIVTLVVFGALLAILYTFAWGPILKGLQARETAQFQAIEDAKKAREEAAALRTQLQTEMSKAADQVRAILEEARRDAEALRASEREAAAKEAEAERERVRRDLALERESLIKDVYTQAVELATLMATKAARVQVSVEKHSKLLDESIAELTANANRA